MIITIMKSLKYRQQRGILSFPAVKNILISHLDLMLGCIYCNSQRESKSLPDQKAKGVHLLVNFSSVNFGCDEGFVEKFSFSLAEESQKQQVMASAHWQWVVDKGELER